MRECAGVTCFSVEYRSLACFTHAACAWPSWERKSLWKKKGQIAAILCDTIAHSFWLCIYNWNRMLSVAFMAAWPFAHCRQHVCSANGMRICVSHPRRQSHVQNVPWRRRFHRRCRCPHISMIMCECTLHLHKYKHQFTLGSCEFPIHHLPISSLSIELSRTNCVHLPYFNFVVL